MQALAVAVFVAYVPGGQSVQTEQPLEEYVPAGQADDRTVVAYTHHGEENGDW